MQKNREIEEKEWEAIARRLYNDEARSEEPVGLGDLEEELLAGISQTARQVDRYLMLKEFDAQQAYEKLHPRLQRPKSILSRLNRPLLKIAAVFVFAVIVASAGFYVGSRPRANLKSAGVAVDNHGLSKIELPDGSVVTLNHDTKINYPEKFSGDTREVQIEGEAFFEVQPDVAKPFVIHAGNAVIRVLGTSFNVNAYPGNAEVEVVVETGKVQVSNRKTEAKDTDRVVLNAGEKGVYILSTSELQKSKNDNPNYLSWKTRDLVFHKTSLTEVLEQLKKVYRVQIKTEDQQTGQLLLTARFEDRSLDFILQVIALTHQLEVKKEHDQYVLMRMNQLNQSEP
ncbi:FecR family protein [Gaoshiqia sp. Z1-71]|uniref:FecR family protein n=1 Tax=Gaoshiqia hydrogeniformans TaxID=3290090 RepID=UPI003BF8E38C